MAQLNEDGRAAESKQKTAPDAENRIAVATQWQLMWWRFRKHRVAVLSAIVLMAFYSVVLLADFLAYSDPYNSKAQRSLAPPQPIHFLDEGKFRPHVLGVVGKRDLVTFQRVYAVDPANKIPIRLFAEGYEYKLLGILTTNIHLIGAVGQPTEDSIFLLGTDVNGRDLWSRLMIGTRLSLTIGLVGVTLSLFLGVLLGGISGLYGGVVDNVIQRLIEIVRSSNRPFEISEDASVLDFSEVTAKIQTGREKIAHTILLNAEKITPQFGIEIRDVRIKRVNYVDEVQRKVFDRMIAERQRIASKYRSEGDGKSAEIRGQKEKELKRIQSEAYRKAQEVMGKADAEATRIYAAAYNLDPELYQFLKTLESYRTSLAKDTWLVLSTDSEFLRYLKSSNR